jgi:hypothetical protein
LIIARMQRVAAIVLVLCFIAVGSGAIEYLHNAQHAAEDARIAAVGFQSDHGRPFHDDSNCAFHTQLHLPAMPAAWVPLLICLGLFVAFLSLLLPPLLPQRTAVLITCRGPPAR